MVKMAFIFSTIQHKASLPVCVETKQRLLQQQINILETPPTDTDLQAARTLQLGVDTDTQTDRLLNIPLLHLNGRKLKEMILTGKNKQKKNS
jgi:hypothetical protein